ncbi:hypothetical protein AWC38_SpisGene18971 [Stylophora pistillata]|uniref:Uncharacterized protein n=1 Tax=Stylophora pistillata TaxID=50429 RepID=A0A2B4RKE9_STYPI|nr:hypothetical protein AWC38_SpisGene18971 [Stylophora pistillata]
MIVENGGNPPEGSTTILYMSRKLGGRDLKSVENEYKNTKIKAAVKLCCNADPTMAAIRSFEELAIRNGRHTTIKDAKTYAEELDLQLLPNFPNSVAVADGRKVEAKKVKQAIHKACQQEIQAKNTPTHTIAGVQELYQQLLPTRVYYNNKNKTKSQVTDEKCRPCGDSLENVQLILSGCSALAQTKYLKRHALKILFFEVLRSLDLITKVEPWFSQVTPKPLYENEDANAFWHVPLFADTTQVKANRIDATVIDKTNKQVRVIKMSCPWLENRESKDFEKTAKYSQLRLELTNRYPEYKVNQYKIIMREILKSL